MICNKTLAPARKKKKKPNNVAEFAEGGISKVLALKQQPEERQPQCQHHRWDA